MDAHHHVYPAWAEQRRELGAPFVPITLDHHTDTRDAFIGFACKESPWNEEERKERRSSRRWLNQM